MFLCLYLDCYDGIEDLFITELVVLKEKVTKLIKDCLKGDEGHCSCFFQCFFFKVRD